MMEKKIKRCAIYTRKSVEDGLEQEFNSLDAQRESAEAYIASQKANGWVCLEKHYDDGGFSGGNINRPALKELLADAEAGLIDIIVIYKIDRLSRSICDFAELSKKFDKWNVAFVAVTQEINTSTSSGRMMLNILMTFAQYEREIIAERVRDKMAASRRKGKWVGGSVAFGYRVEDKKLLPEPVDAEIVRRIFRRFTEIQSPKQIAFELNRDGLRTKQGKLWATPYIYRVLNNRTYIGEVDYKGEICAGEHDGIIEPYLWERCQEILKSNDPIPDRTKCLETITPLKGLLRCGHCNSAMVPLYSNSRNRDKKYFYYHCDKDRKRAVSSCPVKQIPAGEIEKLVSTQLIRILHAPEVLMAISRNVSGSPREVLEMFDGEFWNEITPGERNRLTALLLERIEIKENGVSLEIRTAGMESLIEEMKHHE